MKNLFFKSFVIFICLLLAFISIGLNTASNFPASEFERQVREAEEHNLRSFKQIIPVILSSVIFSEPVDFLVRHIKNYCFYEQSNSFYISICLASLFVHAPPMAFC
jgi:hypothetical protein